MIDIVPVRSTATGNPAHSFPLPSTRVAIDYGLHSMALVIRNLQRAVPLRRARLRRDCQVLRQILGLGHFDLGLICVDNQRMRILNGRYREQEAATDVLSFPFHQVRDWEPGPRPDTSSPFTPTWHMRPFYSGRFMRLLHFQLGIYC